MELREIIEKFANGKYKPINLTCNGKCSKCGECCGNILPIDQEDLEKIKDYVLKNEILPQKQILVMKQKLQCPYYNGNKEKGCSIYMARPKICKIFKCDEIPGYEQFLTLKDTIPVNMWELALAIEKEMNKNATNKKTRKTIN
jgi:Fe-S-cluster containining protein